MGNTVHKVFEGPIRLLQTEKKDQLAYSYMVAHVRCKTSTQSTDLSLKVDQLGLKPVSVLSVMRLRGWQVGSLQVFHA